MGYDPHLGSFITPDPAMDGINHYNYANSNPIKYTDPTGLFKVDWSKHGTGWVGDVRDDGKNGTDYMESHYGAEGFHAGGVGKPRSSSSNNNSSKRQERIRNFANKMSERFPKSERWANLAKGFGFRSNKQIENYLNSPIGKWSREAIDSLKKTKWANSITGMRVIFGLEDAFNRGRVHFSLRENPNWLGKQDGIGRFSNIWINKNGAKIDPNEAIRTLAHEGCHYMHSLLGDRRGYFIEDEIETFRLEDYLKRELEDPNYKIPSIKDIEADIRGYSMVYKLLSSWSNFYNTPFPYFNPQDVGN